MNIEQFTNRKGITRWLIAALILFLLTLYSRTLAQGLILGDPTEYTYVAHILGIAHPPGYAFITLSGRLFQTIVPFGTIAWRMHLHAAVWATLGATMAFGVVHMLGRNRLAAIVGAIFSGIVIGTGADYWQHAIHTNPHIMTAVFLTINLFLLIRWEKTGDMRYLYAFALSTGLGVTHHPLTVFSFPAYTLYILLVRPHILLEWRTLLGMVGSALLGLSLYLYYPIRSSMEPLVGPHTMNTMQGFLDHVLGRGLTESLPYYSVVEQPIRALVFSEIAQLQYGWLPLLCAIVGIGVSFRGNRPQKLAAVLLILAFIGNYAFVMTLKQQDIMAYILGPLVIVGIFAGIGFGQVMAYLQEKTPSWAPPAILGIILVSGIWTVSNRASTISLNDFNEGNQHIDAVFSEFEGQGESVVLLNNWEFMTPLWYTQYVDEHWPNEADVRPIFVSAAEPWLPSVFNYLPGGPVYLNSYRREIVDAGFRLRPRGSFYQVVEPGDISVPEELTRIEQSGEGIELVAYEMPNTLVTAGEFIPLTLAMRIPAETADYFVPVVKVGDIELPFTTDTHLISPLWQADEVIIERFDFALPHNLAEGVYPIEVRIQNLSTNSDVGIAADLGTIDLFAADQIPQTDHLLANFRQRVGLRSAVVWDGAQRTTAPWTDQEPIYAQRGDVLTVIPQWEALDHAEESYTIFVHLIDPANQLYLALDYTPLGGATPTHLWFPKWLPGQTMRDPYRMVIPENIPSGTYLIEVGLYEMTSGRRLHMHDNNGEIVGDRYILGAVLVE